MKEYIGKSYRCESNVGYKDFLTVNKSYEVLDAFDNSIVVISDICVKITVDKCRFRLKYTN